MKFKPYVIGTIVLMTTVYHYSLSDDHHTSYGAGNGLHIHQYCSEYWAKDPVSTEHQAYLHLKKSLWNKEINYLAIPWAPLINSRKLSEIPTIRINGGFTVCQHVDYWMIVPWLKKIGIDTLFTPHADGQFKEINVLPFPHYPVNGIGPAVVKDIWCSFIGANTHHVRSRLFNLVWPKNAVIKKRSGWHFYGQSNWKEQHEKKEYQDVLARSCFSLCPRGTGPSTIRFWESLQAGAIPVLISDAMKLPEGVAWNECIIRVPEKNVDSVIEILKNISPKQEEYMRVKCLEAYEYCCGSNFAQVISSYYQRKSTEIPENSKKKLLVRIIYTLKYLLPEGIFTNLCSYLLVKLNSASALYKKGT